MELYGKVRFTSQHNGNTAGIILTQKEQRELTISQVSARFPISEAFKMERLERSDYFKTFEEALNFDMDSLKR
jgi:hypothetical protein